MSKRLLLFLVLSLVSLGLCAQESVDKRVRFLRGRAESSNARMAAGANYELAKLARERRLHSDPATNDAEYPELLRRAAELGFPRAMLEMAEFYLSSKTIKNHQFALPYLVNLTKVRCSRDFTPREKFKAFYLLGYCYENGKGTRMDAARAQRFYRLASIGNSNARFVLLRNLNAGKNREPVYDLLYEICLADMEPSDLNRVDAFLAKNKMRDDFAAYLDRKSQAGDRIATMILADNLFAGGIFPQQRTKSYEYFRRAVSQGNQEAAMRLGDFHSRGQDGLAKDPAIVEKYYRQAFQNPGLRARVSARLAALAKKRLDELAAAGNKNAEEVQRWKDAYLFYLMNAGQYAEARTFIDGDVSQQFQGNDLYLKAKEYLAAGGDPKQYRERLRMAVNAGYPPAVIEYISGIERSRRTAKQSASLLQAMLSYPEEENPAWLWNVSQLYREVGEGSPLFSLEKSLFYAKKAAEQGSVDALEFLVRSYQNGNKKAGIPVDAAKSEQYRQELLKKDLQMEKVDFFREYMAHLSEKKSCSANDFALILRSIGLSPFADYAYAELLFKGDAGMNIKKDEAHAMMMLHLSARGGNFRRAVEEILRRMQANIKPNRTPDEVQQDQESISSYRSLL